MTCSSSGQWEGAIPRCVKITCARPVSPRNGRVVYNDISFGNNISFSCNPGFELRGSSIATCLETGLYSNDAPSCVPVNCGFPGSVPHAYVIGDSYIFGSVVTYLCEEGYDLIGDDNIVCLETARWSGAPPVCNPVSCGRPPEINNARRMGDEFTYRRMVYYACEKGYELSGNNLLECGADGDWIGSQPTCLPVTCGPPPVLRYSTTIVTKRTFGSTVTYICNEGYLLQGDMMTKCSENGTWSKDPTTACVPIDCGNPPLILQGTAYFTSSTFQSTANYTCNTGYSLKGNSLLRCTAAGSWSGDLPTCTRSSCQVPNVSNGMTVIGNGFGIGDSVEYKCPDGYIIVGQAVSECTTEGTWSSESPRCQHVSCGPLNVLNTNLRITSGRKAEYSYNDSIQFTCDEGHTLIGEGNIRCMKTGKWSGTLPTCQVIRLKSCPRRTALRHAAEFNVSHAIGDVVTVTCKDGYEGIGDLTVECLYDQTWKSPSGRCRRISCGKPVIRDFVNVVQFRGRSYFYGDKVYYRCRPGVRPLKIPPVLTCTATKQWDGQIGCSMPCKGGCMNGGRCMGLRGCKCPNGFGGKRCQKALCILPCLNGGSCIAPYKCSCREGYTGSRCQTTICDPPCENGGYCVKPNKCQCQHGYILPYCREREYV
ncbi:hypothetical protein FSP39_014476 [Pinctada imbricata]|uniref:Sushi, von Willebrand factor type A, EGF and pentraxin domain-containing protein 1-like n=1 Tax=Pinctada imbricata TaxID=66713 RepID=A0AA88Y7A3_PINIB|nr:hypothetical protein FSP39_014476 [Pinctada imbricata]